VLREIKKELQVHQLRNEIRPKFNPLLYEFNIWLANKKLKEINELRRLKQKAKRSGYEFSAASKPGGEIRWIEHLLQTPLDDYG
jgi:hypothetical protein